MQIIAFMISFSMKASTVPTIGTISPAGIIIIANSKHKKTCSDSLTILAQ